jgi:hypothetical protein
MNVFQKGRAVHIYTQPMMGKLRDSIGEGELKESQLLCGEQING